MRISHDLTRPPGMQRGMGKSAIALHSMFEGLFVRALHVEGPLKETLRQKGFDLDKPQPRYPVTVWEDCVDAAVAELFPGVSRGEGWQRIGRRFIEGYFETMVGKVIAVALPFLSAKGFINRSPRFISTGVEGGKVTLEWLDERRALLRVTEAGDESGALMAGVMAVCFERMKQPLPRFEWTAAPGDSTLTITLPD